MKRRSTQPRIKRDGVRQMLAAGLLLAMVGLAVAGPSGIVAWSDNQKLLEQRRTEFAQLSVQRDALKNRVGLLDPNHPDLDFAGELARDRLNVVDRDDKVLLLSR